MSVAVGATVSTTNVPKESTPATPLPLMSWTLPATKLIVYVPRVLAPQLEEGAVIVYVTTLPTCVTPLTVAPLLTVMLPVPKVLVSMPGPPVSE